MTAHLRRLAAILALLGAATPAIGIDVGHADRHRLLRIDGDLVSWHGTDARPPGPVTIVYHIAGERSDDAGKRNCRRIGSISPLLQRSDMSATTFEAALVAAMDRWQKAVAVSFVRTREASQAQLVIGAGLEPTGIAFADVELAPPSIAPVPTATRRIAKSHICLNPHARWTVGFDGNLATYDLVHVLTHELGHILGLDHPSARGHVMSFKYTEREAALTATDIAGARALYGAPVAREAAQHR